jgi:hypothetical protein
VHRRRVIAAATALAAAASLAIVVYGRTAPPIVTASDLAVGEWYLELATGGELLVGAYSRFGWNHPGPMLFYLTAPFYALSGHRAPAMYAVGLAINLTSIATILWIVGSDWRRQRLARVLAVFLFVLVFRVQYLFSSPWNAHVPALACVALITLAAAVASGRLSLLPLLAGFASFVTQSHVGYVPIVAGTVIVTIVWAHASHADERRALWRWLGWAAVVVLILWAPPIAEALSAGGGNPVKLAKFFLAPDAAGHSVRDAMAHLSYGLNGILNPVLYVWFANPVSLSGLSWAIPLAIGQMVLLAAIGYAGLRSDRQFEGRLALFALLATVIGGWSLTRVQGDILSHEVLRFTVLGTLNLAVIAAAGLRLVRRTSVTGPAPRQRVLGAAVAAVLFIVFGIYDLRAFTEFERVGTDRAPIANAYTAIRDHLRAQGLRRPLFQVDQHQWPMAASMLMRLRQDGMTGAVEDNVRWMFTDAAAATGEEDAVISLANLPRHREWQARAGTTVLYESETVNVDARRLDPATAR